MSKNKKSFSRQRSNNVPLPEVVDIDSLSYTNDEDLLRRLDNLYSEKEKAYVANFDLSPWEIEICYVQRELEIRDNRKFFHDKFLKENQHRFDDQSSSTLN